MDGREVQPVTIEPRRVMWAVAEVSWEDDGGIYRIRGTIEDTSRSGACVRVKRPFNVGSKVTIKWHREQFSAVARNCRSDGHDYLLGVSRDSENGNPTQRPAQTVPVKSAETIVAESKNAVPTGASPARALDQVASSTRAHSQRRNQDSSPRHERNDMQPNRLFPQFWRRQQGGDMPEKAMPKEAPVNKPTSNATEAARVSQSALLSYEDIYRAAGIISSRSGYDIHKVVDMLNSERIRDLSPDAKRASVLMALDAAGTSADDLNTEALRRQSALDAYEAGQRKQVEEFEAQKNAENARIEAEIERIRAHYAERIQANRDQVTQEKEALRNWQMAMQHESQRINEVIELCGKRPAAPAPKANAAAAGTGGETSSKLS